eukprot:757182-Hanusia_phi.AAC.5
MKKSVGSLIWNCALLAEKFTKIGETFCPEHRGNSIGKLPSTLSGLSRETLILGEWVEESDQRRRVQGQTSIDTLREYRNF